MTELEALKAIEVLCRMAVEQLDRTNIAVGECDTECENCGTTCNSDVALDLPDEEQDTIRALRLALVQLDLARAPEVK